MWLSFYFVCMLSCCSPPGLLVSAWLNLYYFVGISICVALHLVYQWARDWACISDACPWVTKIEGSWVFLQCAFYLLVVSLGKNLPTLIIAYGVLASFLLKEGSFQVLCRDLARTLLLWVRHWTLRPALWLHYRCAGACTCLWYR